MDQANGHHGWGRGVAFGAEEGVEVVEVGAWGGGFGVGAEPGVDVEVEVGDGGVTGRSVLVVGVGLGRGIGFELDPVEMLDAVLGVGIDEGVEIAIVEAEKDEVVFANVFGGGGELDLNGGIAIGGDGVVLDGAMGSLWG